MISVSVSRRTVMLDGMTTRSPAAGGDSPPHVYGDDQTSMYSYAALSWKAMPVLWMATATCASTDPWCGSVTHSICVSVTEPLMTQSLPAIVTLTSAFDVLLTHSTSVLRDVNNGNLCLQLIDILIYPYMVHVLVHNSACRHSHPNPVPVMVMVVPPPVPPRAGLTPVTRAEPLYV